MNQLKVFCVLAYKIKNIPKYTMTYIANKSIVKHRILNTILLESIFGNYFYILAQFMKNPDIRYSRPEYQNTWNY